jgi:type I restriction enzyme, S subunit
MNWKNFNDILFDTTSGNKKIPQKDYLITGKIPIIDQGKNLIGGYTNNKNFIAKTELPCIIFGDHTKIFKYIDFPFAIGADGVKVLNVKKNIITKYIYFFLNQVKLKGKQSYNRNFKYLKLVNFPIPTPSKQKQIVEKLEKVNDLIQKRKQSIQLLDEYIKSVFYDMFGDPVENPFKFKKGSIRDLVSDVKYGTSSPAEVHGKYPYLRMNNITFDGFMDLSDLKYINISDDEKEKYLVRKGDLLFNRTNSKELVGKTSVFNESTEMIIAGYLIRVRTNELANPWYIWGYLNSIYGKKVLFNICKSIIGMANINAQELQNIKILLPPVSLQNQFAEIVSQVIKTKSKMEESLKEIENLFNSLMQKYFSNN